MRKRPADEDREYFPDYRIEEQPEIFANLVRNAYERQYGCRKQKDIAEILGKSPQRVSQALKHPEDLDSVAVDELLKPLSSARAKRVIIDRWKELKWEKDFRLTTPEEISSMPITAHTFQRINRLLSQKKWQFVAMNAAFLAFQRAEDDDLKDKFLNLLYFAHLRLGNFGRSMYYVRLMIKRAREQQQPLDEAAAHILRATILMQLRRTSWKSLKHVLEVVLDLRTSIAESNEYRRSRRFLSVHIPVLRAQIIAYGMENKLIKVEEASVELCEDLLNSASKVDLDPYIKLNTLILRGRIHLLRREFFNANELLDRAQEFQRDKGLTYGLSICARFRAQIILAEQGAAETEAFLYESICGVESIGDIYTQRVLEFELAAIEESLIDV